MRTQREIEEILNSFMPSPEMRSYLAGQALNEWELGAIIAGAPVALDIKARFASGEDRQVIRRALDELALRPGEIFTLNTAWYDEDLQGQKRSFVGAYLSLEQLIRDIREEDMDAPDSAQPYTIGEATESWVIYDVVFDYLSFEYVSKPLQGKERLLKPLSCLMKMEVAPEVFLDACRLIAAEEHLKKAHPGGWYSDEFYEMVGSKREK